MSVIFTRSGHANKGPSGRRMRAIVKNTAAWILRRLSQEITSTVEEFYRCGFFVPILRNKAHPQLWAAFRAEADIQYWKLTTVKLPIPGCQQPLAEAQNIALEQCL